MNKTAIGKFFALSGKDRSLLAEAAFCLLAVRLAFLFLPFRAALKFMRFSPGESPEGGDAGKEARDAAAAIVLAARHVPCRALCLEQAFAVLLMLRRRGLSGTVHLGLSRAPGTTLLAAHAWSRCGRTCLTGADNADRFTPVGTFAA
ncbi:MAG: lasso peptide biosynthesis B2 protein [Rhizomicrobium sp.]